MLPKMGRPRIHIFSLGGTIASTAVPDESGVSPKLSAQDLLGTLPSSMPDIDLQATSFRQMPSSDLLMDDVIALAREIESCFKNGVDGVVITQGTSTIEEVAFALDLLVRSPNPIVVTGAMRNPTLAGADGPANLLAAVEVARSTETRNLGTLVVFNDEIHAARYVRKAHTSSPAAFQSFGVGPLGMFIEHQARILVRPAPLEDMPSPVIDTAPPVALIRMTLGDDGRLVNSVIDAGYEGLVIEGFGGGHVMSGLVTSLERVAAQIPVIIASRTGAGYVLSDTYGFPGGEKDLLARGLISALHLDGAKARVLLALCLRSKMGSADTAGYFSKIAASI